MRYPVKAKKHLGQHFLTDKNIAQNIVDQLTPINGNVLEIGCGTGILTEILAKNESYHIVAVDVDTESIGYLQDKLSHTSVRFELSDFLKCDLLNYFSEEFSIIGNFPYNISTQIVFKILENRDIVPEMVGMFQREVALRISGKEGNKQYGILSVLVQAFYDVEYLFTVPETVFSPPPKVKSAVIKFNRKESWKLSCSETLFFKVVKTAFNQRRKTLRNSLRSMLHGKDHPLDGMRPEQLTYQQFIDLTHFIASNQ